MKLNNNYVNKMKKYIPGKHGFRTCILYIIFYLH